MADLPSADPNISDVFNGNINFLDELLQGFEKPSRARSEFSIPASKQERGKPYYVHEQFRCVTTKPGNRFPVELTSIQAGDAIRISVLYSHEDHIDERVKCDCHQCIFEVEPRTPELHLAPPLIYDNINVCSLTFVYSGSQGNEAKFRFVPIGLNSCSKVCSDRTLKLEHLSRDGTVLETSEWELRVCSIPKRDFELMVASRDPDTGEKRKSLYSKASGKKKIKLEPEELVSSSVECKNPLAFSQDMEDVNKAINLVTGQTDQPSTSRPTPLPEEIILICDDESSPPPLLQEKAIARYDDLSGTSPAASLSPIFVQMNSEEDEELVRNLIHRLGGTVHELKRKT